MIRISHEMTPNHRENMRGGDGTVTILPLLTPEEDAVFKRGRNAAVHGIPKNATTAQYHQATALECLLGWLYLQGDTKRVNQLFTVMMEEDQPCR